jgi:hypothetical protein
MRLAHGIAVEFKGVPLFAAASLASALAQPAAIAAGAPIAGLLLRLTTRRGHLRVQTTTIS